MRFTDSANFKPGFIPVEFQQHHIPCATIVTYEDNNVLIFTQRIRLKNFVFQFHIIRVTGSPRKTIIHPQTSSDLLTIHYMLAGGAIDAYLASGGYYPLREDEHSMFLVKSGTPHTALVEPGTYWCFHIDILPHTQQLIQDNVLFFSKLLEVISKEGGTINPVPFTTTADQVVLITKILTCKLVGEQARQHMENCARELLLKFGQQLNNYILSLFEDDKLTDQEIANLYAFQAHVCNNLSSSTDLYKVASQFGLTHSRMNQCMQELFGISAQKYFEIKRMRKAYELLAVSSLPVSAVMRMVGLEGSTSFTQYFGISPVELRNTYRQ